MNDQARATARPGWNLHAVVDDVAVVCGAAVELGGEVAHGSSALGVLTDPAGAGFVVREPGWRAELSHVPMAFSWAELCTRDVESARSFYRALFGWDTTEVSLSMPAGAGRLHGFPRRFGGGGGAAAGRGRVRSGRAAVLAAYVEAADADKIAARAEELGGAVLVEPFDVPRIGRIALLAGRSGEPFAIMQMAPSS